MPTQQDPYLDIGDSADVSVIIINYGTAELALKAAASVFAWPAGGRRVDIHLVDNASPSGDALRLLNGIRAHGWEGRVTLYAEQENHGFGRGNNFVLRVLAKRRQPPEFVLLLNPDARLENDSIDVLASFLTIHPKVAVAGARITKPDGLPVTAAFRFPCLISVFSNALSFGPVARRLARWEVPLPPDLSTGPVDWVAGAAMMVRWEALMEVGGFDPAFFLYYEEVDLMQQLARRGWQTWYVAEAHVIHSEGAATGVKSGEERRRRRPAYWYESWQHYFRKNHGRSYALIAAAAWIIGAFLNRAIAVLLRRTAAEPLNFVGDFWAAGCRPLLGLKGRRYD